MKIALIFSCLFRPRQFRVALFNTPLAILLMWTHITLSCYHLGHFLSLKREIFAFCLGLSRDALLSSSLMGFWRWRWMCGVDASYRLFSFGLVHSFFGLLFLRVVLYLWWSVKYPKTKCKDHFLFEQSI